MSGVGAIGYRCDTPQDPERGPRRTGGGEVRATAAGAARTRVRRRARAVLWRTRGEQAKATVWGGARKAISHFLNSVHVGSGQAICARVA